jgi:hypothetical protein
MPKDFKRKPKMFDAITGECTKLIKEYLTWAKEYYPRPIYRAKKSAISKVSREASLTANGLTGFKSRIIELTKIGE